MTRDAVAELLLPLPEGPPDLDAIEVASLAEHLVERRRLGRAASSAEAAVLLFAATAVGHPQTTDLVRIGLADAAVRAALQSDEAAVARHLPEFRRLAPAHWDGDAFCLLELPANAPPEMRLRHLRIEDGRVPLTMDLLHFHAVAHLARRLPSTFGPPDWLKARFNGVLEVLTRARAAEEARRARLERLEDVPADYPPCVRTWLSSLSAGLHLKHFARYNLLAFLGRIGWSRQRLMGLFDGRPGYDAGEMAYQVGHVKGDSGDQRPGYAPMGCDQLRSLALCPDLSCPGPTPLSVYRRRRRKPTWSRQRTP